MNRFIGMIFISVMGFAQNYNLQPSFYSEMQERVFPKKYEVLKVGCATQISVTDTVFGLEIKAEKKYYYFKNPNEFNVKKYLNNKLIADEVVKIDTLHRVLFYEGKHKNNAEDWYSTKMRYTYTTGKKIKEKVNDCGKAGFRYTVVYDSLKNPVKCTTTLILESNHSKSESINYDYKNGTYLLESIDYLGESSIKKGSIFTDYIISKNQYGDITKMYWILANKNKPVIYEIDYVYDKQGNWIKKTQNICMSDGFKKVYSSTYRTITYNE